MFDYDLEVSDAEQKWFVLIMLAGAIYNMFLALSLAMPFMIMDKVVERLLG